MSSSLKPFCFTYSGEVFCLMAASKLGSGASFGRLKLSASGLICVGAVGCVGSTSSMTPHIDGSHISPSLS